MSTLERRVALRNSGLVDPRDIGSYIERGRGYLALTRALKTGPTATLARLEEGGLEAVDRPGSLAARWRECREAPGDVKYVVCGAVDTDPLSPTARLLLSTDPHTVLEGLLLAAVAVGAEHCFVCVNSDYVDEREILEVALAQMRERGLLGDDVLGSGCSLDVTVREVARSLYSAEETALLRALEGAQPLPYLRAPDSLWRGLHGRPTLIEDAETLAKVSAVLHHDWEPDPADGEAGVERGESNVEEALSGDLRWGATKIVTVSGDVKQVSTVEVPLGTTIRAVLQGTLGGSFAADSVWAVQLGGPTGCLCAYGELDLPISLVELAEVGCPLGSGGIRVFTPGGCAVELARDLTSSLYEESCGKCVFCREGTRQIVDILGDVLGGQADESQMALLKELCAAMITSNICALGREARLPVLSALHLFAEDFEAHLAGGPCPGAE